MCDTSSSLHVRQPSRRSVMCVLVLSISVLGLLNSHTTALGRTGDHSTSSRCDKYHGEWKEPEKWAWRYICSGHLADFNGVARGEDLGQDAPTVLEPTNPDHNDKWADAKRSLGSAFLRTILLEEPFRSSLPHSGVRIAGAYFPEGLNLNDVSLDRPLSLRTSFFNSVVEMRNFETSKFLSMTRSKFPFSLELASASIRGDLILTGGEFRNVMLQTADVGGRVDMRGAKVHGDVYAAGATIAKDLILRSRRFKAYHIYRFVRQAGDRGGFPKLSQGRFETELGRATAARMYSVFRGRDRATAIAGLDDETKKKLRSALKTALVAVYSTEFAQVDLSGVRVGGVVDVTGVRLSKALTLRSASLDGGLLMSGYTYSLRGRDSEFARLLGVGELLMDDIEFQSRFTDVDLSLANIAGNVEMANSLFDKGIVMAETSVQGSLIVRDARFGGPVVLTGINVGADVDARGSTLGEVNLTGGGIKRRLQLGPSGENSVQWKRVTDGDGKQHIGRLLLRNAEVGVLQDTKEAWPSYLQLDGLVYHRFETVQDAGLHERGRTWFRDWLAKSTRPQLQERKSYSRQPYQQLAQVLRARGLSGMADDIRFEGRERQRDYLARHEIISAERFHFWRLTVLKWIYGYGYGGRTFRVLAWLVVFVVLGTAVLWYWKEDGEPRIIASVTDKAWYSLDMFLPVIHLRERHYHDEFDLTKRPVQYYFYIHKIVGYVLTLFLIAGLSGFTE